MPAAIDPRVSAQNGKTEHMGETMSTKVYTRTSYTVFALFFAAVLAFIDRQLLNILVMPIRADIGISDVQFSLLQGAAFGLVYSLMTFPVAFLSDRFSRKMVLIVSVVAWSAMCLVFGLASSFAVLFIARVGLAIGEAGLSPAAISIVRQIFPAHRQSFAVAILTLSVYVGGGLSMVIGGPALGALQNVQDGLPFGLAPWRTLFVVSAALGVVAVLVLAFMPEPARPPRVQNEGSFREFITLLTAQRRRVGAYLAAFLGIHGLVVAVMSWTPTVFIREHGWTTQETGLIYGLVYMAGGIVGALAGGRAVGLLTIRGSRHPVAAICLVAALMLGLSTVGFGLASSDLIALACAGLAMIAIGTLLALGSYGLQAMMPAVFSARSVALYFVIPGTLGSSAGPTAVPLIESALGGGGLGTAMAIFAAITSLWAVFWLTVLLRTPPAPTSLMSTDGPTMPTAPNPTR